ncbi:transcriptional regulator, IclR family [Paracoccus laeviglucosivorans]|uniref:Transcriptional regulator, IclR family n=1 Tax=Paracoccus laeviglucosivorans TaxID=1197861 RepID=A0A521FEC7_9RHOB|nr:IclR family transcriptional regulator [Paracoccus laeviglucosivorans]SMO94523.1 transcriptional regulator, IclR family [Paracoccus laeviglucosivorans]
MSDKDEKNGDGLQSVVMTMHILEQVARSPRGVGVTGLANTLGTSKSRVHRHLQTLVQQGYVTQPEDSERYEVGHRLIALGQTVFDSSGLQRAAQDPLLALRDALGHSAVASQFTPDGMLVIETIPGRSPIEIGVRVGSILSFHASAQGKVATAFSSPEFQARVLRNKLELFTPHTITTSSLLIEEFAQIRRQGWATAPNQIALGLDTLACPIFDASGRVCGSVGIVDMVQQFGDRPSDLHIRQTQLAANQISERLGFAGPA